MNRIKDEGVSKVILTRSSTKQVQYREMIPYNKKHKQEGYYQEHEKNSEYEIVEALDMGHFEEGDEDSDSVDEETIQEFTEDDEAANIPFINMMNSNFSQLKKQDEVTYTLGSQFQVPYLKP